MYRKSLQITARILKEKPRLLKDTGEIKNKEAKPEPAVSSEQPVIQLPQKKESVPIAFSPKPSEKPPVQAKCVPPDIQLQDAQVYQKLIKEFCFADTEKVISISLDPSMLLRADLALLRILLEKNMKGIILCAGRPAEFYITSLRSSGLNPDLLYFIDTLTFCSSKKKDETPGTKLVYRHSFYYQEKQNIKLVPHPSDFTAIDLAFSHSVEELMRSKNGERLFLLIDGLASHQLYVKASALGAFIHILVSKARNFDISTILLLSDGVDPILTNTIKTFSDKIITIN